MADRKDKQAPPPGVSDKARRLGQEPDPTEVDRDPGILGEEARERAGEMAPPQSEAQEREARTGPKPGGNPAVQRPRAPEAHPDTEEPADVDEALEAERRDLAAREAGAASGDGRDLDAGHLDEDDLDTAVDEARRGGRED